MNTSWKAIAVSIARIAAQVDRRTHHLAARFMDTSAPPSVWKNSQEYADKIKDYQEMEYASIVASV